MRIPGDRPRSFSNSARRSTQGVLPVPPTVRLPTPITGTGSFFGAPGRGPACAGRPIATGRRAARRRRTRAWPGGSAGCRHGTARGLRRGRGPSRRGGPPPKPERPAAYFRGLLRPVEQPLKGFRQLRGAGDFEAGPGRPELIRDGLEVLHVRSGDNRLAEKSRLENVMPAAMRQRARP